MKSLKYTILVTCISFTLVVLLNGILTFFGLNTTLTGEGVIEIFVICLIIAFLIVEGRHVKVLSEHFGLYGYVVVLLVAVMGDALIYQRFYWVNIVVQIAFLSLVYVGVWFLLYIIEYKDAQTINKIIGNKHNHKKE